jgi:hypothetical protein
MALIGPFSRLFTGQVWLHSSFLHQSQSSNRLYLRYAERCVALVAKSTNPGDKARCCKWRKHGALSTKRDDD